MNNMIRKESSVCGKGRLHLQGTRFLLVLVLAVCCSACTTSSKNSEKTRMKTEEVDTRGTTLPNEKNFPEENILLEAPPLEGNALLEAPSLDDNSLLEALPLEDFVFSMESPAESSIANLESDGMNYGNPMLEESLVGEVNKENIEKVIPTVKEFTEKQYKSTATVRLPSIDNDWSKEIMKKAEIVDGTPHVVGNLSKRFIPFNLLEVPHNPAQKIEIAIQVVPKPATGVNIFLLSSELDTYITEPGIPSQSTQISSPSQEGFPEVARAPKNKVRIVTRKHPLRVRKGPNLNSKILTVLPKGSLVPFVTEKTGWFKVEFSTGQMGWISKKYSQLME